MNISLDLASIFLTILGAFSILIGSLYNETSGGDMTKPWYRRYWWYSWRPFYKNTLTHKWMTKWNRIIMKDGFKNENKR